MKFLGGIRIAMKGILVKSILTQKGYGTTVKSARTL